MLASVAIHLRLNRFRISLMVGEGSDVWVRSTDAAAAMARYTAAISSPGGRSLQVSIARRPATIIFADTGICSARPTGFTIGVPQVRWHSEPSGLRRPFASRCLSRATGDLDLRLCDTLSAESPNATQILHAGTPVTGASLSASVQVSSGQPFAFQLASLVRHAFLGGK
jgi:hypothetical protein